MNILTASRLFTFVREGRFQQRALFTVLYSPFKHCAKDVSKVTAQPTILEFNPLFYRNLVFLYVYYYCNMLLVLIS